MGLRVPWAYVLGWLPLFALCVLALSLRDQTLWHQALLISIPLCIIYALVCRSSLYLARTLSIRKTDPLRLATILSSATAFAAGIWTLAATGLARLFYQEAGVALLGDLSMIFALGCGFFLLTLAYHYLSLALAQTHRAQVRRQEAEILSRQAELKALRLQLDPHFLFNSLNSIAALTTKDPEKARSMCLRLSDFARQTLHSADKQKISLKEELEFARNYLAIEQQRFSDKMQLAEDIDPDALGVEVPPLLIQPLVENAVKHGITGLTQTAVINLTIKKIAEHLSIKVSNPFDPQAPKKRGTGQGIQLVRRRLENNYGKQATMRVNNDSDLNLFSVELEVPHE
jgi:two-component sensor histidine kinase